MTRITGSESNGPDSSAEIKSEPRDIRVPKSATLSRTGGGKLADVLAYPPRGMRADRAAAYLGMSTSAFFRLVDAGDLPRAVSIGGMMIWDRLELDAAFESLKDPDKSGNSMHKILGIKP